MNRIKEIEKRLKAIGVESQDEKSDVKALGTEMDTLIEERKGLLADVETRKKLASTVSALGDTSTSVVESFKEERGGSKDESVDVVGLSSKEYRSAFIKELMGKGASMTDAEKRAFVHTTGNTEALLVPATLAGEIYNQMKENHPLLADVDLQRTGTIVAIRKHVSIVAGDAKVSGEIEANEDEENEFVSIELSGDKINKHVDVSYKMLKLSAPDFEAYITKEIADRIASKMTDEIVAQIKEDLPASNLINVATPGVVAATDVLAALGALKNAPGAMIYANNTTLFTQIAAMVDPSGRYLLLGDNNSDIVGRLFGKPMKEEDALADGEILIISPKQFYYNVAQDITIETDRDIKKGIVTIAGHAFAEGTMKYDRAAVVITVGTEVVTP